MEISIPSFLDFLGLGSVSGIDILFASMALIGTGLFVLYFSSSSSLDLLTVSSKAPSTSTLTWTQALRLSC